MPWTEATICEVQRIKTILPLGVPHGTLDVNNSLSLLSRFKFYFLLWCLRIAIWLVIGSLKGPWSCPSGGQWISIRPCGRILCNSVRSASLSTCRTGAELARPSGDWRSRTVSCRSSAGAACASETISAGPSSSCSLWLCSSISACPSLPDSTTISTDEWNPSTASLWCRIPIRWPSPQDDGLRFFSFPTPHLEAKKNKRIGGGSVPVFACHLLGFDFPSGRMGGIPAVISLRVREVWCCVSSCHCPVVMAKKGRLLNFAKSSSSLIYRRKVRLSFLDL